ncbi:TPA: YfjI family protein [Legionella pneumophila]
MNYKDITVKNLVQQFREEIKKHGLEPPENIEPGKTYLFPGVGKSGNDTAGWCKLLPNYKIGIFGDASTSFERLWLFNKEGNDIQNIKENIFRPLRSSEFSNTNKASTFVPQVVSNFSGCAKDIFDGGICEDLGELTTNNSLPEGEAIPIPLPDDLPPVKSLLPEMLPECIRDFIFDVAKRQQCPPDFVAVTALVSLSGLLGRKILIRPKQKDNWTVTPNQWGAIIGRPSAMKSPSMKEALRPLIQFESDAASCYKILQKEYEEEFQLNELEKLRNKNIAKKAVEQNQIAEARLALKMIDIAVPPTRQRFVINDSTVEKLGELLNENPNGLVLARDELFGWLSKLLKEENQAERAFYLECFDGNGYFTYDRIGRGTIEIENCILSVIGGIQPAKLATLIRSAIQGTGDDGLVQRFQLAVWPDDIGIWKWIDREPDALAKAKYFDAFERIRNMALPSRDESPPFLYFSVEAQKLFIQWLEEIQIKAHEEETHPALESHMLKMPQTIAGLALLFELLEGYGESVGVAATARALEWADYLISHAYKIYSVATNQGLSGAKLIIARRHKLPDQFSVRDIQRKEWTGFNDLVSVINALNWLIDYKYIRAIEVSSGSKGGRPTTLYQWNNKF